MKNGMQTLTAFLESHWQLVITFITKRQTGLENGTEKGMENKLSVFFQESCQCFHSIFKFSPPFSNTSYFKLSVCLQESCQCFHSIFHSFFHSVFWSSPPFSNTNLSPHVLHIGHTSQQSPLYAPVILWPFQVITKFDKVCWAENYYMVYCLEQLI